MTDAKVRSPIEECEGLSDEQIIAAHHADYYDKAKPHVRAAFEQLGIAEHEVSAWVQRHIK